MDRTKSIELLNRAVSDELSAVHQYMYFHFHLDDQGFGPLALLYKRTAIEEMMHIERLAERILFLKGEVELVASVAVEKITEPEKVLAKAVAMEGQSIADYNEWAKVCAAHSDAQSKQLFESLIADEERRILEWAMADLPERQRAAIALFHMEGLSGEDAAHAMNLGAKAFESLLGRARAALKQNVQKIQDTGRCA